jgi:hypothetical protein
LPPPGAPAGLPASPASPKPAVPVETAGGFPRPPQLQACEGVASPPKKKRGRPRIYVPWWEQTGMTPEEWEAGFVVPVEMEVDLETVL